MTQTWKRNQWFFLVKVKNAIGTITKNLHFPRGITKKYLIKEHSFYMLSVEQNFYQTSTFSHDDGIPERILEMREQN